MSDSCKTNYGSSYINRKIIKNIAFKAEI